ncbi:MAG: MraY family glycosyltransferase [Cyanobacteriota bacterium]|jgi:Fuc2NAc and GlcNAc transferase
MVNAFLQFLWASVFSWLTLLLLLPLLKKSFVDVPNIRSSHQRPTPRGGGVSFVVIGSLFNWIFSAGVMRWIPIICLPLAMVGLVDDRLDLPATWRYAAQLITAAALLSVSNISVPLWSLILYVVIITAIINFFNFMDGLDGLVAGCGCLLLAAASSWALSGAIFGFLLLNWSPAKVFMGDVGSTFIGAVFGGIILQQQTSQDAINLFLIGFPLIADASTCLLRRFVKGENIFIAHRDHLFQRLNRAGWTHSKVAGLYLGATALLVLAQKTYGLMALIICISLEFIIGFYLDVKTGTKLSNS